MLEGLWIVQYEGTQGEDAGVIVFTQGRVLGGDNGFTYEGNYVVKDGWVAASVHIAKFMPNVASVLGGDDDFDAEIKAPIRGTVVQGTLNVAGNPELGLAIRLTKKADL